MKEFSKKKLLKKISYIIQNDPGLQPSPSVSIIAFFIEDFFLELEQQNELFDPKDSSLFEKQTAILLKKLSSNKSWLPVLTLEVKYQQKIIAILQDKNSKQSQLDQVNELEHQITTFNFQKTSKNSKRDIEKLSQLIQQFILTKEILLLDQFLQKTEIDTKKKLISKTLETALPALEIHKFVELNLNAKKQHLEELSFIHTGITVFKNEFENLDSILEPTGLDETVYLPLLQSFSEDSFSEQLKNLIDLIDSIEDKDCSEMEFNAQIELKLVWQKLIQLKNLLDTQFQSMLNNRNKSLAQVELLIEFSNKPNQTMKDVIFPIFSELGLIFKSLLSSQRIIKQLLDFVVQITVNLVFSIQLLPRLNSASKETLSKMTDLTLHPRFSLVSADTQNFQDIKLSFNGMCLVSLVCDGNLLYGNPNEVILHDVVKKYNLCFFNTEKANEFLKSPDQVYEYAQQSLQDYKMLMFLMDYDSLQKYKFFIETINEEIQNENIKCFNTGVQTPVHIVERCIDHNYYWNEWDLRRQAIKMANIRNKKTIGCQTGSSYFKVNNETQIWPLKDQTTMTEIDKGTNPIWPRNYILGLRSVDTK